MLTNLTVIIISQYTYVLVSILYTLNLYSAVYQLYPNKTKTKKERIAGNV